MRSSAAMGGYGAREVAKLVGLSVAQVRAYVRAGFLEPTRGPHGEQRFSFQDLVLLRTAKGLVSARIAPRRVRSALRKLKQSLPEGRPLRGVHIRAEGDRIVVGDGRAQWAPDTGQVLFDFGARDLARKVAPLQRHARGGDAAPPAHLPQAGAGVSLLVGTSGYNYEAWRGSFYPQDLSAKKMLAFYAERFGTVEINYSFYRKPTAKILQGWAAQVPERF